MRSKWFLGWIAKTVNLLNQKKMQGAISNIDAVERWFKANEAPYYTISYYSTQSPTGQGQVIGRNTKEGDLETAWSRLKSLIQDQTGFGRAQLHLLVYETPGGANTPKARTNIDITATSQNLQSAAFIGSTPAGYVTEDAIEKALNAARERWDLEARIASLEAAPEADFTDKLLTAFERIGSTPLGAMLAAKILGAPIPAMPSPVNGTGHQGGPEDQDGDEIGAELDDLETLAEAHGMTLKQFLSKTANLARQQPGVVAMLSQQ